MDAKIRFKERIKHYGNMFIGENHEYETVLQFKDEAGEWKDVETVKLIKS